MQLPIKKILVLGGGFEQLPLIQMLKKENLFIILIDKNKNAVGKTLSNKFYNISITKHEEIIKICKKNKIFAATSICSDLAVVPLSKISGYFKVPGIPLSSAIICTNKIIMKRHFVKNKIPTTKFHLFKNLQLTKKMLLKMQYPIVVKPIDSYGQKGVFKVNSYDQLKSKFLLSKEKSQKKKIIIEEFIDGTEINVVAIVKNYKVKILSMSKRSTYSDKFFGIAFEHSYPVNMSKRILNNIKNLSIKTIKSLKIKNGVLYPQIIYNKIKGPYVIEIAARVPGGFMRELSLLASGIDPIRFQIECALGFKRKLIKNIKIKPKKSIIIKFLTKKNFTNLNHKIYNKLNKINKFKGIFKIYISKLKKIPNLNSSTGRFGAIIAHGKNIQESYKNCNKAFSEIKK